MYQNEILQEDQRAVSSQGMQNHFGAKSANWLAGWLASFTGLSTSFPISSGIICNKITVLQQKISKFSH